MISHGKSLTLQKRSAFSFSAHSARAHRLTQFAGFSRLKSLSDSCRITAVPAKSLSLAGVRSAGITFGHEAFYRHPPTAQNEATVRSRPPMARMMLLHENFKAGAFPNCRKLADELEVSTKTFQRDIDFMRDRFGLAHRMRPASFQVRLYRTPGHRDEYR